jgi:hypothetical protein
MSVISIVRCQDHVVIGGDGVAYDDDGVILRIAPKVFPLPELNMILGNLGAGGITEALCIRLRSLGFTNFDEVLPTLPRHAEDELDNYCMHYGIADASITLVVAGWSDERQRFESYRLYSYPKPLVDDETRQVVETVEPWTLCPTPEVWVSTFTDMETLQACGLDWGVNNDSLSMAAALVAAARTVSGLRSPEDFVDGMSNAGHYAVGGFIQLRVLRRDFGGTWIVHRWPDVVGQRVDPDAGVLAPPLPISLA